MNRRNFIRVCGLSLLLAGCGNSSNSDTVVSASPTVPGGPLGISSSPTVGREGQDVVFAFDAQGNAYEIQPRTARVTRLSPSGQVVWETGTKGLAANQLDTPIALSADTQGRLWVLDRALGKLVLLDVASGAVAGEVAQRQLGVPQDVVVGPSQVYVSDVLNHRVAVFSLNGQPLANLNRAPLEYPRGLALDSDGRVHVVDAARHEVIVFSPDGTEVATYGGSGAGQGRFRHSRGLAIRAVDGLIAVVDSVEADIKLFSASLQPLGIVAPDVQPLDVQFGPDGQLYVSGTRRNA